MELWSSLLNHHLHRGLEPAFADPAGCSSYGARHATCKIKAPRERSTQTTPSRNLTVGVMQLVTVRSPEPVGGKMAAPTGKGTPTDDHSRRPETLQGRQWKGGPRGRCCHDAARRVPLVRQKSPKACGKSHKARESACPWPPSMKVAFVPPVLHSNIVLARFFGGIWVYYDFRQPVGLAPL